MLFGFDLNQLLYFPVETAAARKNFLIGAALILAGFVIPVIPYLLVIGYVMQIMRQVLNGAKPSLPAWENWETLLKDGAKLFFVRLIYSLPLLLVMLPVFLAMFALPFLASTSERFEGLFSIAFLFSFPLLFVCLLPLSLAFAVIVPAAEAHVVARGSFSAGFEIGAWWPIFRKNLGGFIIAFCIYYGISMVASIFFQILSMTIILICIFPLIIPALSMYLMLILFTVTAQAYREGQAKLAQPAASPA